MIIFAIVFTIVVALILLYICIATLSVSGDLSDIEYNLHIAVDELSKSKEQIRIAEAEVVALKKKIAALIETCKCTAT